MNELQTRQLEMLKACLDIFEKLHLRYYLVCGSALGAAKYQGFIPWDDDLDIGLPRADYEVFIQNAQAMLPDFYFLQNYHTDSVFAHIFTKLRDCRTTYIETSAAQLPINHGVYIDVFPLDGYPVDQTEIRYLERKKRQFQRKLSCAFGAPKSFNAKLRYIVKRGLGWHKNTHKTLQKYEELISRYPIENSALICNHGNWQGVLEYAPRAQYGEGAWATFEGLKVRIPERFDEYLTQKYGDWRADLPKEQQVGHHYATVIDLTRPYTDYIEVLKNGKVRLKRPDA